MELLDIPNGTVSPLVGLPEGSVPDANPTTYVPVDGASHALLGYDVDTYPWQRYALVDLATGVAVSITAMQGVNHATEFTRTGVTDPCRC
jgi:hypothetical protein